MVSPDRAEPRQKARPESSSLNFIRQEFVGRFSVQHAFASPSRHLNHEVILETYLDKD